MVVNPKWWSANPQNYIYPDKRYIYNNRSLAEYVHNDFGFQEGLNTCLMLLTLANQDNNIFDSTNPYLTSKTQTGSATFGNAHFLDFTVKAVRVAFETLGIRNGLCIDMVRAQNNLWPGSNYLV